MILGVDGGGTKTVAVVVSDSGRVLGTGRSGPSNPRVLGLEKAMANVRSAVRAATEGCPGECEIHRAVFGLAGVDVAADESRLERALSEALGLTRARVLVRNDAEVALVGAVAGGRGVAVCAGTGAIAVGADGKGHVVRAGGWGYLLGDEGSGYWIGVTAIRSILRRHDGRGRRGCGLETAVLGALGLTEAPELLEWAYGASIDGIAGLAPFVLAAAERDAAAAAIAGQAGVELGRAACAVIRRLDLGSETFPLVALGGLFGSARSAVLQKALEGTVCRVAPDGVWRLPEFRAEFGAVLLGASLNGEVSSEFIDNLRLSPGRAEEDA
ncbi:MAG: BadF/BadG/BcrA/BcrD ATPase family protein [Candidatus Bipolaricaulis sp.]|nr:BadF/BadG/BcrA/BcrD ATPase family protein [Candidatus Bipolaricaulis sp.]